MEAKGVTNNKYKTDIFYLLLMILSLTLLAWHQWGMNYRTQIFPNPSLVPGMLNDNISGGNSIASLTATDQQIELSCETVLSPHTFPFCSILLDLTVEGKGQDLRRYQFLTVELEFNSSQRDTVLVYLQNKEKLSASGVELNRANMKAIYPVSPSSSYILPLADFHLPSWWLFNHADDTPSLAPRMDNVVALQISTGDNRIPRSETITVSKLVLAGKWLSKQQVYGIILLVWFTLFSLHGLARFRTLTSSYQRAQQKAASLMRMNEFLQIEKNKFETMAQIDPLTQIHNRVGIRDSLSKAITDYLSMTTPCVLIILDIDNFKIINDTWGHEAGDRVLQQLASTIKNQIRQQDCFARWGGEEFILICQQTRLSTAIQFAEKLRVLIEEKTFIAETQVTCSFGLAELTGNEVSEWFNCADKKLYQAKKAGRNCIRY
jgi:diguanylate cyclase (GGDEF)-like protein